MISDDDLRKVAEQFAQIVAPDYPQRFIEDFEMGAKWMRHKMRKEYEQDFPQATRTGDQDRNGSQQTQKAGTSTRLRSLS